MTYLLEAPSDPPYVWVLTDLPIWDGREPNPFHLLAAGDLEALGVTPRFVQRNRGSRWGDLLWTTGNSKIMSIRLRDVLEAIGATGWKQFDVEVVGQGRRTVQGYVGLAVTSTSPEHDLHHSDGSNSHRFHASDRVVSALRSEGVTDLVMTEEA